MTVELALDLLALAKKIDAGDSWDMAFKKSMTVILQAAKDNPAWNASQLFTAADVLDAVTEPFVQAGTDTIEAVRQAWGSDDSPADLNKIIANVRANTKSAPVRIRTAIRGGPKNEMSDRLAKLAKEMRLRAEYAVQYAQRRGVTNHQLADAPPGATKTWTNTDPKCSACKALAGTTIGVGELFDESLGGLKLGTFSKLTGPPRHPNCLCTLTILG